MWTKKRIYLLKENISIVPMLFSLCRSVIIPHFLRFVNPFEIFLLNWGLSVPSNFNLKPVGGDVLCPRTNGTNQPYGYKLRKRAEPRPSPAGKVDWQNPYILKVLTRRMRRASYCKSISRAISSSTAPVRRKRLSAVPLPRWGRPTKRGANCSTNQKLK